MSPRRALRALPDVHRGVIIVTIAIAAVALITPAAASELADPEPTGPPTGRPTVLGRERDAASAGGRNTGGDSDVEVFAGAFLKSGTGIAAVDHPVDLPVWPVPAPEPAAVLAPPPPPPPPPPPRAAPAAAAPAATAAAPAAPAPAPGPAPTCSRASAGP